MKWITQHRYLLSGSLDGSYQRDGVTHLNKQMSILGLLGSSNSQGVLFFGGKKIAEMPCVDYLARN